MCSTRGGVHVQLQKQIASTLQLLDPPLDLDLNCAGLMLCMQVWVMQARMHMGKPLPHLITCTVSFLLNRSRATDSDLCLGSSMEGWAAMAADTTCRRMGAQARSLAQVKACAAGAAP